MKPWCVTARGFTMEPEEQKIKELVETVLAKMGVRGEVNILETTENVQFQIKTPEAGLLIGEGGENLIALNHLLKRMAQTQLGRDKIQFAIDVNDYQRQRAEELRDLARLSAQRVRYFRKEIELKPMSSYERRIVHAALTEYPDITTQSVGEGPNRRVVIKPFIPEV